MPKGYVISFKSDHNSEISIFQVITCSGPSGTNIEYVLRLAHAVRQLETAIEDADDHLAELETEVIRLCRLRGIYDPVLSELGHGDKTSFSASLQNGSS